jgi:transcription elongation factor GreB
MSKAFLREDADPGAADEDADAPGAAKAAYITPAGHARLTQELAHLWHTERPRVTHEVAVAAAQGDRSENAEYIYGKKRLREIDRRIRWLAKRLDVLTVVVPAPQQRGRVFFGAWVEIEDDDGDLSRYRIVGPDETDADAGHISVDSPLARALLGKSIDDVVTVRRPKGAAEVTIRSITYPPEPSPRLSRPSNGA